MTTIKKAADLPEGSVVANGHTAWIKGSGDRWGDTGDEAGVFDLDVQERLDAGAVVLREGH